MLWKISPRIKRFAAAAALIAVIFAALPCLPAAAARTFVGDEPADQNNLTGDAAAERQIEGFLMPLDASGGLTAGGAVAVAAGGGLAGLGAAVAGPVTGAVSVLANYKGLAWKNWPMDRYLFWHYPPDKVLGFLPQMSGVTLWAMDTVANAIFSITKFLTIAGINLMWLAFNSNWLLGMADWIGKAAKEIFVFNGKSFASLALNFGIVLFLIAAMMKLLRGYMADTVKALVVAVLALAAVMGYTANAANLVRFMTNFTDGLSGAALSASASYFWQDQSGTQFKSALDRGIANAGAAVWEACVADPWAASLFGTADPNKLKVTPEEWAVVDKSVFPPDKAAELDKKVQDGTLYADTLFLACGDDKARDAVAEMLGQASTLNTGGTLAKAGKQAGSNIGVYKPKPINHGEHPGSVVGVAPSTGVVLQHIGAALLTLGPALLFFLLILIVGGIIIVSQILLAFLLIFAPAALLAALVPDAGWALAVRYFKSMLSFLVNKLIFGVYLGGILALATGVVRGILQ